MRGRPFYGYTAGDRVFVKVMMLSPPDVLKAAALLQVAPSLLSGTPLAFAPQSVATSCLVQPGNAKPIATHCMRPVFGSVLTQQLLNRLPCALH